MKKDNPENKQRKLCILEESIDLNDGVEFRLKLKNKFVKCKLIKFKFYIN